MIQVRVTKTPARKESAIDGNLANRLDTIDEEIVRKYDRREQTKDKTHARIV